MQELKMQYFKLKTKRSHWRKVRTIRYEVKLFPFTLSQKLLGQVCSVRVSIVMNEQNAASELSMLLIWIARHSFLSIYTSKSCWWMSNVEWFHIFPLGKPNPCLLSQLAGFSFTFIIVNKHCDKTTRDTKLKNGVNHFVRIQVFAANAWNCNRSTATMGDTKLTYVLDVPHV